jgi:hypothetical protein
MCTDESVEAFASRRFLRQAFGKPEFKTGLEARADLGRSWTYSGHAGPDVSWTVICNHASPEDFESGLANEVKVRIWHIGAEVKAGLKPARTNHLALWGADLRDGGESAAIEDEAVSIEGMPLLSSLGCS